LLEEQIRARGADPDDPGGWARREPSSGGSLYYPHQGAAFLGGQPSASPGITDAQLIYDITSIVEREAPGEFRIERSATGFVELHPIHQQPIVQRSATASPLPPRTPDAYPQLMTALFSAACRWRTRQWDIPELPRPGQERHQSQPRWMGNASGRWNASLQRRPATRHDAPSDPNDSTRREYVYIAIQLAPTDCRVPAEWEC
jgi:hypothetical protein